MQTEKEKGLSIGSSKKKILIKYYYERIRRDVTNFIKWMLLAIRTALKMKVKYKYIARLFDKSLRASACSPPRPLPPLTAHRSTVPIHP